MGDTVFIPLSYWFEPTHNSCFPTIAYCYMDTYKEHMLSCLMDNLHAVNMEKFIKHDWARNALCEKNRLLKFELILNRNLKNFKDNHRLV